MHPHVGEANELPTSTQNLNDVEDINNSSEYLSNHYLLAAILFFCIATFVIVLGSCLYKFECLSVHLYLRRFANHFGFRYFSTSTQTQNITTSNAFTSISMDNLPQKDVETALMAHADKSANQTSHPDIENMESLTLIFITVESTKNHNFINDINTISLI